MKNEENGPAQELKAEETENQGNAAVQTQSAPAPEGGNGTSGNKKKKIVFLSVGIGILVILLIIAAVLIFGKGGGSCTGAQKINTKIDAKITADGTAVLPLMDGKYITIQDDVQEAVITEDREHVIARLSDNTLYVTDPDQTEKTIISEKCSILYDDYVCNDGFFYADDTDTAYRVAFSDFSAVEMGSIHNLRTAENSMSVLYSTKDSDIYILKSTATERTKVGQSPESIELNAISDNGEIAVWTTTNESTHTITLYENDEKTTLGQVEGKYSHTTAAFSEDQGLLVVNNDDSDRLWIKYAGEEPIDVKLNNPPRSVIYTNDAYLSKVQSGDVKSLYVSTSGESMFDVYRISMEGDRERVLSKVVDFEISKGNIYYMNEEGTLYCAKLEGDSIAEEQKIASDVESFELTGSGQYVYYIKNYDDDDEVGTLYCYKAGEKEPLRVSTEVGYSPWGWTYNHYSIDGDSVLFYKDLEQAGDSYERYGTLMLWNYGDDSAAKISSEAMTYSIKTGLRYGFDSNKFVFEKFVTVDDAEEYILTNWMFYNGKETEKFASDIRN